MDVRLGKRRRKGSVRETYEKMGKKLKADEGNWKEKEKKSRKGNTKDERMEKSTMQGGLKRNWSKEIEMEKKKGGGGTEKIETEGREGQWREIIEETE